MRLLRVYSENPITIMEYKKLVTLAKSSPSVQEDILKEFPERCKEILCKKKKSVIVYLDKVDASSHKYETKFD